MDPKNKVLPGPGTIIGANVKLVGALRDVNDITVHGSVDGEVHSEKTVTIGETATVKGPVTGAVVTVSGTVRGSIDADSRLEILPTGKVNGNIATKDLIIRSGAVFVGKSAMIGDDKEKLPDDVTDEPVHDEAVKETSKPGYEVE